MAKKKENKKVSKNKGKFAKNREKFSKNKNKDKKNLSVKDKGINKRAYQNNNKKANQDKNNSVKTKNSTKKEKKERFHKWKMAHNKNFALVVLMTQSWEKIRHSDVPEETRDKIISNIMKKVEGEVINVVRNPKASRVLQFCLKHSDIEQRKNISKEVEKQLKVLSKDKYGKHMLQKMIDVSSDKVFKSIYKALRIDSWELLKHAFGSDVIGDLYHRCDEKQKCELLTLLCTNDISAQDIIKDENKENNGYKFSLVEYLSSKDVMIQNKIVNNLQKNLNVVIEKGLIISQLTHKLMCEYIDSVISISTTLLLDVIEVLASTIDGILKICHTEEGARVAAAVMKYSKESSRKLIIKGMKDYIVQTVTHKYGHILILQCFKVVDDIKLLKKVIISNIISNFDEIKDSKYGIRILLWLINPDTKMCLSNEILKIITHKDLESDEKINGDEKTRRKEMLSFGKNSLSHKIINYCKDNIKEVMCSSKLYLLILEVIIGGSDCDNILWAIDSDGITHIHSLIINLLKKEYSEIDDNDIENKVKSKILMNSEYASFVLVNAIQCGSKTEASRQFSLNLWKEFIKNIYNDKFTNFIKILIRAFKKTDITDIINDENFEEILNKCYVD